MVYQGHVGGIPMHYINNITTIATKGLKRPDMEFILDIPAEIGLERIRANGREINEMDKLDISFHKKVNDAFRYSSYSYARRVIDATQSKDEVFHRIMEAINKII
jgi:dTMP kinase